MEEVRLRDATQADVPRICAIHNQGEGVSDLLIWYPLLEAQCNQLCVGVP